MTLRAMIQADVANVFLNVNDFAVGAVYNSTASGIINRAIRVILDFNAKLSPTEFGSADTATIYVRAADIPNPVIYDVITIATVPYIVQTRINGDADGIWALSCITDKRQSPQGA
ncbi:MAG: hypothetical protein DDT36_01691 [Firmicutes bacterium]|nr:hypothetical protein [Bacillota bacterium]